MPTRPGEQGRRLEAVGGEPIDIGGRVGRHCDIAFLGTAVFDILSIVVGAVMDISVRPVCDPLPL